MDRIRLNYNHRYPRFEFKNGSKVFGMMWGIFNSSKGVMEYYFAESNELRKYNLKSLAHSLDAVKKIKRTIQPSDVLGIEYLN